MKENTILISKFALEIHAWDEKRKEKSETGNGYFKSMHHSHNLKIIEKVVQSLPEKWNLKDNDKEIYARSNGRYDTCPFP